MRNRGIRIFLAAAAGVCAVCFSQGTKQLWETEERGRECQARQAQTPSMMAWWGMLYPDFCFSKEPGEGKVKIRFWLAKELDW